MSFKSLKQNAQKYTAALEEKIQDENKSGYESDPNDWYPGVDKAGNGQHLIRFLPRITDEDIEYARWWSFSFLDPNSKKWYIENCRFSLNKSSDPVMDFNKKLWDSVEDSESAKLHPNRVQARRQARKQNYRANIFVIEDGVNPENNGKVKKFKFGKWVYDKIDGLMFPKFANKKKINPFDLWAGANFRIEIFTERKDGENMRNYSGSGFESPGPLADDDEMEKIFNQIAGNQEWSIKKYLEESNFKSYDELLKRLDEVVKIKTSDWTPDLTSIAQTSVNANAGTFKKQDQPKTAEVKTTNVPKDESSDFFANLKSGDDAIPF